MGRWCIMGVLSVHRLILPRLDILTLKASTPRVCILYIFTTYTAHCICTKYTIPTALLILHTHAYIDMLFLDYYLEVAQNKPDLATTTEAGGGEVTWTGLFKHSLYSEHFQQALDLTLHTQSAQASTKQPSSLTRFAVLLRHFMIYCIKEKGLYYYRTIALVFIGVFVGTLYLNLQPATDKITEYGKYMSVYCLL